MIQVESNIDYIPGHTSSDSNVALQQLKEELAAAKRELDALRNDAEFQLEMTGRLHRSLLPSPVRHPRIDVDVRYMPIDTVSGVYCQVRFPVLSTCYVTMCDISGRGTGPCLLATRVSSEVRHFIMDSMRPREMVEALNAFIFDHFPDFHDTGWILSFVAARIELESKTISYSGAGHPGPLQLRGTQTKVLKSQNQSIGVRRDLLTAKPEHTQTLADGDRLLFYTKGLTQATNAKAQVLGQSGLAQIAADARHVELFKLTDRILEQQARFRFGDD